MTAPYKTTGAVTLPNLKVWVASFMLGIGALSVQDSFALTYLIPANSNIVGQIRTATVQPGDSLGSLGLRYGIGGYEMKEANPGVPYLSPRAGMQLTIPQQFILPSAPRKGIVINLAEMRLYHYHKDGQRVSTYPIGIGKQGWLTPIGTSSIVRKRENPWWIVPDSILEKHRRMGKPIAPKKPPGPDNPLGAHAMNLGFKNIVIHGTPYPMGVGLRSSHGCIRMMPRDIAELFYNVEVGTQVTVVHEPQKIGYRGSEVFMESHVPLSESIYRSQVKSVNSLLEKVSTYAGFGGAAIQWQQANHLINRASGYPQKIGVFQ